MIKRRATENESSHVHRHNRNGRPTHEELIRALSAEERAALEVLAGDPWRRPMSSHQAYQLLKLGLAELSCGRLVLTSTGITALAVLRDP